MRIRISASEVNTLIQMIIQMWPQELKELGIAPTLHKQQGAQKSAQETSPLSILLSGLRERGKRGVINMQCI